MTTEPEKIRAAIAATTPEQAAALARALAELIPHKEPLALLADCKKDGRSPAQCVRSLLGSAYDWFAYGN